MLPRNGAGRNFLIWLELIEPRVAKSITHNRGPATKLLFVRLAGEIPKTSYACIEVVYWWFLVLHGIAKIFTPPKGRGFMRLNKTLSQYDCILSHFMVIISI